eukprot:646187-Pelagomonas_calceolata.AAC.2
MHAQAYRGKYMNRASRIASVARPGQVLASADVWNACQPQAMQKKLCASSLGHFNLKGVASPLEIFSVTSRVPSYKHQGLVAWGTSTSWAWLACQRSFLWHAYVEVRQASQGCLYQEHASQGQCAPLSKGAFAGGLGE